MKKRIIKHYNKLFNYIGSTKPEGKINEPILINVIQSYNNIFFEPPGPNEKLTNEILKQIEIFKNELIELFKNKVSLFDYYINKLALKEEKNIVKKNQKLSNIEKKLKEDKENTIISEEKLKEIIKKEKNNKNNSINKDSLGAIIMPFYLLCLNSENFKNDEKIKNLISKLNNLKEKEQK